MKMGTLTEREQACIEACAGIATADLDAGAVDGLVTASRALLDWAREHTSPIAPNSPHALLVALMQALEPFG